MNGDANVGFWNVNVVESGDYEVRLRRWPIESGAAIQDIDTRTLTQKLKTLGAVYEYRP